MASASGGEEWCVCAGERSCGPPGEQPTPQLVVGRLRRNSRSELGGGSGWRWSRWAV